MMIPASLTTDGHHRCLNARRRRKHGLRPYLGTSWMAPPPGSPPPDQPCYGDPYYQQNPPPQYTTNSQSYGYFGSQPQPQQPQQEGQEGQERQERQERQGQPPPQTNGIELQAHPTAYQQDDQKTHAPPPSPPPDKQ